MLWTAPCWWSLCLPNRAHHLPTALECPQLVHGRILLLLSSDDSRVRFCQFLLLQIPSSSRKTPPFHVGYQYLKHRKFVTLDMDMKDNRIVDISVLWIWWFWFSIESVHSSWRKDMNVSTFTPSKTSPSLTLGPILASRSSWTDLSTVVIQKMAVVQRGSHVSIDWETLWFFWAQRLCIYVILNSAVFIDFQRIRIFRSHVPFLQGWFNTPLEHTP